MRLLSRLKNEQKNAAILLHLLHAPPDTNNSEQMDFCKDCGGVLNLFGNNTSERCSSCIQHSKSNAAPTPAISSTSDTDILLDTFISYENGKIILHSKEGWQLWSGPGDKKTEMATIVKSARLIYKIRNKRKNKK